MLCDRLQRRLFSWTLTMFDLAVIMDIFTRFPLVFYLCVFVFCILVGSFLNVVIYRLPVMMLRDWQQQTLDYYGAELPKAFIKKYQPKGRFDLIKPDSTCKKCQHKIRAWENIPIFSYLFLRGRCSQCSTHISIRYPLVELTTGLIGVWAALHFGVTLQTLVLIFASFLLISMIMIDIDHMLLPDDLTLGLLWLGLIAAMNNVFVTLPDALLGVIFGYGILWAIYWGFKLLTGKEGMGYGDFKLLAALGAFVGWQHLLIIILLSSVVGLVLGLLLPTLNKDSNGIQSSPPPKTNKDIESNAGNIPNKALPFGPFLGIAGWLTILYGDLIQSYYLTWVLR